MSLYFIKSDFKKDKDGNYSLGVSKASSIFYRVVDSDEGLEALKAARPDLNMTDALDPASISTQVFGAITGMVTAS